MAKSGKIKNIVKALLIAFDNGLTRQELQASIDGTDARDIDEALSALKAECAGEERAFDIKEVAGKVFIATKPEYAPWVKNLYQRQPERLTGPSLETLAIIAYKQPVTRAEVSAIRGVEVGGVIKTLLEKELIDIRGRKDVIGKPLLYGTTDKFLELFGLNSLNDLPGLKSFTEEDLEFAKPQEHVIVENTEESNGAAGPGQGEESPSARMEPAVTKESADDEAKESELSQE